MQADVKDIGDTLESMVDGFIILDEKGDICRMNKAARDLFCYTESEIAGKSVETIIKAEFPRLIGSKGEFDGIRKNGSSFSIDFSLSPANGGGKKIFIGVARDISARKLIEEELKKTHAEMEQFTYFASHDLKAPLRGINNLAIWISEDLAGVMTPDAQEKIDLMRNRVARLETLLEDILKYSRAGRLEDSPEEIDVNDLLRQIAIPLAADGKFDITIGEGMPIIRSSRTPLEQVFSNLISNAIKHHDKGTGKITITGAPQGEFYAFCIADDGPGIPASFHQKAFQMFQTLRPRDSKEGSGLGLSIVKKLVEAKDGKVWIMSDPEKRGAEFHFTWPLGRA